MSRSDLGWAQCQTWLHAGHPGALRPYSKRPRQSVISLGCSPSSGLGTTGALAKASGPRRQLQPVHEAREHIRDVLPWPRTPQMSKNPSNARA